MGLLIVFIISEDIRKRATDLQSKFILTDEVRAERVRDAVKDLHFVEEVFVIGRVHGCTSVDLLFEDDGKGSLYTDSKLIPLYNLYFFMLSVVNVIGYFFRLPGTVRN